MKKKIILELASDNLIDTMGDYNNSPDDEREFINFWFNKKTLRIASIWNSYNHEYILKQQKYWDKKIDDITVDKKFYTVLHNLFYFEQTINPFSRN